MRDQIIAPPIDLAALPRELEGKWVLVRVKAGDQEIISSGDDPYEIVRGCNTDDPDLLLAQVPREYSVSIPLRAGLP